MDGMIILVSLALSYIVVDVLHGRREAKRNRVIVKRIIGYREHLMVSHPNIHASQLDYMTTQFALANEVEDWKALIEEYGSDN
jgi:hypothetical protein